MHWYVIRELHVFITFREHNTDRLSALCLQSNIIRIQNRPRNCRSEGKIILIDYSRSLRFCLWASYTVVLITWNAVVFRQHDTITDSWNKRREYILYDYNVCAFHAKISGKIGIMIRIQLYVYPVVLYNIG